LIARERLSGLISHPSLSHHVIDVAQHDQSTEVEVTVSIADIADIHNAIHY